jgi:hypothetical protein
MMRFLIIGINMQKKLEYTLTGCALSLLNIYLIPTRFNIVGICFGVIGAVFLVKAALIRK